MKGLTKTIVALVLVMTLVATMGMSAMAAGNYSTKTTYQANGQIKVEAKAMGLEAGDIVTYVATTDAADVNENTIVYINQAEADKDGKDKDEKMDAKEEKQLFPRTPSVYFDEIPEPELTDDGRGRIGHATYDISAPELLIGQSFDIRPVTIASLTHPQKGVILLGEIFGYSAEAARNSDKYNVVFDIFDGVSCMEVKKYGLTLDEEKELSKLLSNGTAVAMQGYIKKETRKNYTDIDFTFFYSDVLKIKKLGRMDKAEKKRVELHLHTTMSSMEEGSSAGICRPDCTIRANSTSVLSVTVLPPVFGPVTSKILKSLPSLTLSLIWSITTKCPSPSISTITSLAVFEPRSIIPIFSKLVTPLIAF